MKLGIFTLAAIATTALTAAASQAAVQKFTLNGANAWATFDQPSGCIDNNASVQASTEVTNQGGSSSTTHLEVVIFSVNNCNDQILIDAETFQDIASTNFYVDKKASTAHLTTVVDLHDFVTDITSPVTINLS